jgi:hypothetical protein
MTQNFKFQLYGLFCPINKEMKYIGVTKNGLNRRLSSHLRNPTNFLIKRWFNNLNNLGTKPEIKLLKECETYEELLKCEIEEIKRCRDLGFELYNISDGGDINPMLGKTHTDEARKKISLAHKGRKISDNEKLIRKERLKELWSNPEWSKKVREKMFGCSNCNRNGKNNPNWRGGHQNLICSCGNKKKHYSKNCFKCREISGEKNPFFNKKHSEETLLILSEKSKKFGKDNPNFKYDISKDDLYNLYIIRNKTINEISSYYNCAINTINKKLRQYKIYKPKSNIYNLVVNEIRNHLLEGLNYVQIGKIYGCSNKIIYKFVKKHNIYVK